MPIFRFFREVFFSEGCERVCQDKYISVGREDIAHVVILLYVVSYLDLYYMLRSSGLCVGTLLLVLRLRVTY